MLKKFRSINNSLSEQILQQAKAIFTIDNLRQKVQPLQKLSSMLYKLKIEIPQSMHKQILRVNKFQSNPSFSFRQFTHFIARATLQVQVEQQIKNIFSFIDKNKDGYVYPDDILTFFKQLNSDQVITQQDADSLMQEVDFLKLGYLTYQDFVYVVLPK